MALTFKLEETQAERLIQSIEKLSDNVAKWQGETALAIEQGFSNLGIVLTGGDPEDIQAKIDENTARVRAVRESLQTSINNQTKETE